MKYSEDNWRNDPGLVSTIFYKKRYAFLPKVVNGKRIWLKNYYTKYIGWGTKVFRKNVANDPENYHLHIDTCESITEEDYIIVKLSEGI